MNVYEVIGWTNFDNPDYPICDEYVAIDCEVIAELKEKG